VKAVVKPRPSSDREPAGSQRTDQGQREQLERFVDAREAGAFIGIRPKTLLAMARDGRVPAHPLSGKRHRMWRFLRSELDAWARGKVNTGCDPVG
jgi:predicted DNA-binding transcriptional regulator AlpA